MIAYIKGKLKQKSDNYIIIFVEYNVGGIGYKVYMSQTNIEKIGNVGDMVETYIYQQITENDQSLFGFLTTEELRMFELLLSVSGIGAKSAQNMLNKIAPSSFALAVISNDTSALLKVPGIGKKTAGRIILELKDKIKTEEAIAKSDEKLQTVIEENEKLGEAKEALQVLGYTKRDIDNVFESEDIDSLSVEDIIKLGLRLLSR